MFKLFLKTAWRNIKTYWLYNMINIVGLSVAISITLFIAIIVQFETNYDSFNKSKSSIYRVIENLHYEGSAPEISASVSYPLASFLKNQNGEVERYTRVFPANSPSLYSSLSISFNESEYNLDDAICTDSNFLKIFSYKVLAGNKENLLKEPNTIILTKSFANKVFGDFASALNKIVDLNSGDSIIKFRVNGIIDDFPIQSHLQTNALLPFPKNFDTGEIGRDWSVLLGSTYLLIPKINNQQDLAKKLSAEVHTENQFIDIQLQPLLNIHLGSYDFSYDNLNNKKSKKTDLNLFIISAAVLIIIACGNYININFALIGYRSKEVAIKKIAGAKRVHLIYQFLIENIMIVGLSMILGLLLIFAFFPQMQSLFNLQISYADFFTTGFFLTILALMMVLICLTSFYPTFAFSSVGIVNVLKKNNFFTSKSGLMKVLIVCQFSFACIIMISIMVIHKQITFLNTKPLGYNYQNIINAPIKKTLSSSTVNYLVDEIKKMNNVNDVCYSKRGIGTGAGLFGVSFTDNKGKIQDETCLTYFVSPNFLKFFKVHFTDGREFNKANNNDEYIINQSLYKKLGWTNLNGKDIHLSWMRQGEVAGVVEDFHFSSLREKVQPLLICTINDPSDVQNIYIKLNNITMPLNTNNELNKLWKALFNEPFSYTYMTDQLKHNYKSENQISYVVFIASCVSIFVAAIGLFGMSIFSSQKRIKEISIRKVLGAKSINLIFNLFSEYLKSILLSIIIAIPISIIILNKWLENYAYRINLNAGLFLIAGLILIVVSFFAIFYQAFKVSTANPIKNLK